MCTMARLARAVVPDIPHHVTQRGNRRQPTFFCDDDYLLYRDLIAESCRAAGVGVWAYCLMPNHVHLILTPSDRDGLRAALGEAHRRYSRHVNLREGWRGYLWQGRFASVAMDEPHLMACARYVEMNPVRAGLTSAAEDWRWSSASAHLAGRNDGLADVRPLLERAPDWRELLASALPQADYEAIRRGERTGRPLGTAAFVERLEGQLGRTLAPQKRGRKPKAV
jgi:putative transposase